MSFLDEISPPRRNARTYSIIQQPLTNICLIIILNQFQWLIADMNKNHIDAWRRASTNMVLRRVCEIFAQKKKNLRESKTNRRQKWNCNVNSLGHRLWGRAYTNALHIRANTTRNLHSYYPRFYTHAVYIRTNSLNESLIGSTEWISFIGIVFGRILGAKGKCVISPQANTICTQLAQVKITRRVCATSVECKWNLIDFCMFFRKLFGLVSAPIGDNWTYFTSHSLISDSSAALREVFTVQNCLNQHTASTGRTFRHNRS